MMSTTFTHTQYVKDRVNNVKSTVVAPSEATTLNELQEHVNQKIPEVTRNHTVSDGKHRDELPQREEGKLSRSEMDQRITEMRMRPTSRTPRLCGLESPKL